jgi:hypothetical protein
MHRSESNKTLNERKVSGNVFSKRMILVTRGFSLRAS